MKIIFEMNDLSEAGPILGGIVTLANLYEASKKLKASQSSGSPSVVPVPSHPVHVQNPEDPAPTGEEDDSPSDLDIEVKQESPGKIEDKSQPEPKKRRTHRQAVLEEAESLGIEYSTKDRTDVVEKRIAKFKADQETEKSPKQPEDSKTESAPPKGVDENMEIEPVDEIGREPEDPEGKKAAKDPADPEGKKARYSVKDIGDLCLKYLKELPGDREQLKSRLYDTIMVKYGGSRRTTEIEKAGKINAVGDALVAALAVTELAKRYSADVAVGLMKLIGQADRFIDFPADKHLALIDACDEEMLKRG